MPFWMKPATLWTNERRGGGHWEKTGQGREEDASIVGLQRGCFFNGATTTAAAAAGTTAAPDAPDIGNH
jgi:hypothetical protein